MISPFVTKLTSAEKAKYLEYVARTAVLKAILGEYF
jgi:hypothetical protein